MNTGRRKHDPFAPRSKATTADAPTAEAPAEQSEQPESAQGFAAILDAIPNDIDHITLKELRELAARAEVPDYGTKAEIIARIRAAAEK